MHPFCHGTVECSSAGGVGKFSDFMQHHGFADVPLSFRWARDGKPVPTCVLRPGASHGGGNAAFQAGPFDLSENLRRLCADIAVRCPDFRHVDASRLLIGMTRARGRHRHGLQARVTPLRFEGGKLFRERRGNLYGVQRYFVDGREMLYHVMFCVPRFLDQELHEKLITVFHELYHIHPEFNGDLRRHQGRCCLHTHSKRRYDERMAELVRSYLASGPDRRLYESLQLNSRQLLMRHGAIRGFVVPRPKVVPITAGEIALA
jgi:hypothetical protein